MAVKISADKCKGCSLCVKACPFGAIDMAERKAVINDKCTMCGVCVESCKFGAITKDEEESENDLSAYRDVWVFAEQRAGVITPVVFELLGKGHDLAADIGDARLCAILLGNAWRT